MNPRQSEDLQQLEAMLERFGANQDRWPDRLRGRLRNLIESNSEAKRLYAQAAALDQVLAKAKVVPEKDTYDALAERIMDGVTGDRRDSGNNVVDIGARRPVSGVGAGALRSWSDAAAAGVLAASLMLGVFAGSIGWFDTAAEGIAVAMGVEVEPFGDLDGPGSAFDGVGIGGLVEDLL